MRLMSQEIKQDQQMFMLLNQRTAEERLAYFLHSLSLRFNQRGFSSSEFRLTMTRSEIGNFLGLTVETISRLLSKFDKDDIINVEGKLMAKPLKKKVKPFLLNVCGHLDLTKFIAFAI